LEFEEFGAGERRGAAGEGRSPLGASIKFITNLTIALGLRGEEEEEGRGRLLTRIQIYRKFDNLLLSARGRRVGDAKSGQIRTKFEGAGWLQESRL